MVLIILGLVLVGASIHLEDVWVATPAAVLFPCGIIFPFRYYRRFAAKRIIRGVRLADIPKKSRLGGFDVETRWVSQEDASGAGSLIGAGIGAIFLGPIGALAGSAAGSLLGLIIGESLAARKRKLYNSVVESVNQTIPQMMEEFSRRLDATEKAMSQAIRENFARNVRAVVGLFKS